MNIKEAIEHCWDRKDYPEVFRDDAGLDISIPGFITRGSWIRNNSPRTVTLDVTTYRGVSWNAVHYYGNIIIDGVSFSPEDSPNTYTMCTETYEAEEKNPLAAGFYRIELVRPVTSEEIEKDSSRWNDRWKLRCLEMAGVDNWTWYDQAMSDYEADEYTNDELTKDYNEAN